MRFRLLTLVLLPLLLAGCLSLAEDITPPPGYVAPTPVPTLAVVFPDSAPDVNSGAAIYAEKCIQCHGPTGQGDGPQAADLPVAPAPLGQADFAFDKTPLRWYGMVTQGNLASFMPGFASLSVQQRWDVAAYALSLSATAEQVQAGEALYEAHCAECHGSDGRQLPEASLADQARMAALSNQDIAVLIQKGLPPEMPAADLSDVDAAHLAAYARTLALSTSQTAAATAPTPQPAAPTPEADSAEDMPPAAEATPAQQRGSIGGVIAHGAGRQVPAGLTVTLHTFVHDFATQQFTEGEPRQTTTSAGGKYSFSDLPLSSSDAYYVSVEYQGVEYESREVIPASEGLQDYDRPITLYEASADASNLVISTAHILLEYSQPGVIQIVEFFVLENIGNETIVAPEAGGPVIEIPLPAGYQNLEFENGVLGGRFLQTADGFGDTVPIPPSNGQNQYSLVFAFEMPYEAEASPLAGLFGGKKFELRQPFSLKTNLLNLLVPQGVVAEGQNLTDGGLQSMGGGFTFQLYRAGSLQAGQVFSAQISGAPTATSDDQAQPGGLSRNLIIGIGAFGAALVVAGIFLYWRDRQTRADEEELDDDDEDEDDELSQDDLLDAIIALDDQFRAGNLPEAAYQQRRAELKARLPKP